MDITALLLLVIAILAIALIVSIAYNIYLRKKLDDSRWQLSWFRREHH